MVAAAFVVVHVDELILEGQFDVAPAATGAHAVELGAVGVVALLAAEEEATAFHVPALEVIRLGDVGLRLHVGPVRQPSAFDTQAVVVAGEFGGGDEVVVGVLDVVGVDIFLAADVGGVAAAETRPAVDAQFVRSLGRVVHHSAAHMDTQVGFVDGANDGFGDVGKAFVHAVVLVVGFHIVAGLLAFDLLEEHTGTAEEILVGVFGEDAEVAAGSQGADDHRAFHELEVTRRRVAREREVGFLATDAELEVLQSVVAHDSVFQLEGAVGQFHIHLTVPVGGDLCLDGEAGAADAGAVADGVGPLLLPEVGTEVDLHSGVEPEFVVFVF